MKEEKLEKQEGRFLKYLSPIVPQREVSDSSREDQELPYVYHSSVNPLAQVVTCTNQSLNLAGLHAASVAIRSVTFFGTIEKLFCFFSSSHHRWDVLTAVTGVLTNHRDSLEC